MTIVQKHSKQFNNLIIVCNDTNSRIKFCIQICTISQETISFVTIRLPVELNTFYSRLERFKSTEWLVSGPTGSLAESSPSYYCPLVSLNLHQS